MNNETLTFLIHLKGYNDFWYITLLKCAAKSPKLARDCIDEACKHLTNSNLSSEGVNPFEICKLVNEKHPLLESIQECIGNSAWKYYRENQILKALTSLSSNKLNMITPV